jgi:hypothetical protein
MKNLIVPAFLIAMISGCLTDSGDDEKGPDYYRSATRDQVGKFDHPGQPSLQLQIRNYTGKWSGLEYNLVFDQSLFQETNQSDADHEFSIKNGGTVPGYILLETIKYKGESPKAWDLVNNLHKKAGQKTVDNIQKEVAPVKFGENDVYLFQDKNSAGFVQDAIIMSAGEAIHIKLQSQDPNQIAADKDKEAFKTFLVSITIK